MGIPSELSNLMARIEVLEAQVKSLQCGAARGIPKEHSAEWLAGHREGWTQAMAAKRDTNGE